MDGLIRVLTTHSWTVVHDFVKWIRSEENIDIPLGASSADIKEIYDKISIGDVIGFVSGELPDGEIVSADNFYHMAVVTGLWPSKILYSAHTKSRFGQNLLEFSNKNLFVIFHIYPEAK